MFGLISRRVHEREVAELKADNARLRGERDQFAKDRDTTMAATKAIARQFTEAHTHLPAPPVGPSTAIASAEDIAAWEARIKAHDAWTPDPDPENRPTDGAPGRPLHPATELVRALDRCSQLEARLAKAEGRDRRKGLGS
jgi:hypothetical protein